MSSILLTTDGDFDLSSRGWQITTDLQTLAIQTIRGRVLMFLGEWFLDTRQGFPWFEIVFVKAPDLQVIRLLLRQAILTAPMVASLSKSEVAFDPSTRILTYSFEAKLNDGSSVTFGEGTPYVLVPKL